MTLEEYEWTLKAGVKSETGTGRLFRALGFDEDAAQAEARASVLRTCLRLLEEVKEECQKN